MLNWEKVTWPSLEKAVYRPLFALANTLFVTVRFTFIEVNLEHFKKKKNLKVNWKNGLLASIWKSSSNGHYKGWLTPCIWDYDFWLGFSSCSNQIPGFLDHQYLKKKSINLLVFLHKVSHQEKVASETTTLGGYGQLCVSSNQIAGFFDHQCLWKESSIS